MVLYTDGYKYIQVLRSNLVIFYIGTQNNLLPMQGTASMHSTIQLTQFSVVYYFLVKTPMGSQTKEKLPKVLYIFIEQCGQCMGGNYKKKNALPFFPI